jgi:hypothetical protein
MLERLSADCLPHNFGIRIIFLARAKGERVSELSSEKKKKIVIVSSSVVDPDPPGSAFILLSWMRIRIQDYEN